MPIPVLWLGTVGRRKQAVRRMRFLNGIVNSWWCICPLMCHLKMHLHRGKSNLTSRTGLEILFSYSSQFPFIWNKIKETSEQDHILGFFHISLFLSYVCSFYWTVFCSHLPSVEVENKCPSVSKMGPVLHEHSWSSPSMISAKMSRSYWPKEVLIPPSSTCTAM